VEKVNAQLTLQFESRYPSINGDERWTVNSTTKLLSSGLYPPLFFRASIHNSHAKENCTKTGAANLSELRCDKYPNVATSG
jgi:hypothetical protein